MSGEGRSQNAENAAENPDRERAGGKAQPAMPERVLSPHAMVTATPKAPLGLGEWVLQGLLCAPSDEGCESAKLYACVTLRFVDVLLGPVSTHALFFERGRCFAGLSCLAGLAAVANTAPVDAELGAPREAAVRLASPEAATLMRRRSKGAAESPGDRAGGNVVRKTL